MEALQLPYEVKASTGGLKSRWIPVTADGKIVTYEYEEGIVDIFLGLCDKDSVESAMQQVSDEVAKYPVEALLTHHYFRNNTEIDNEKWCVSERGFNLYTNPSCSVETSIVSTDKNTGWEMVIWATIQLKKGD